MKVSEAIARERPLLSLEITPPDKGHGIGEIFAALDPLVGHKPRFINVTYHQPHVEFVETDAGIAKVHRTKRPGTVGICASIKQRYGVEPVPHFICGGFTRYETEDALIDLQYLGIENIFAVRGDPPPNAHAFTPEPDGHCWAAGLVEQIASMNRGLYLEPLKGARPTDFCIGVACYPEKHFESPNLETDLRILKRKEEMGAEFAITQMFFRAEPYFSFLERAREAGVTIPILPGLKPVTTERQLRSLPREFHVEIPNELAGRLENARTREESFAVGVEHTARLAEKLLAAGVPGLHLFIMGSGKAEAAVLGRIFG